MSEQQPTGITVHHDGEATNYSTATDAFVGQRGELVVRRINSDTSTFSEERAKTLAIYRSWDSLDVHEQGSPATPCVVVTVDGEVFGRFVDERIAEHARQVAPKGRLR